MPLLSQSRARRPLRPRGGFTLIELLVVISIIVILVGLTISVAGYAQNKARRSRAEAEVRALSTALESYKTDNGIYPRDANTSDKLDARAQGSPDAYYSAASQFLYSQLVGQKPDAFGYPPKPEPGARVYFDFKPNQLGATDASAKKTGTFQVNSITDPWVAPYGYSTACAAEIERKQALTPPDTTPSTKGINPTFDLWSVANKPTSNANTSTQQPMWITNW